MIDDSVDTLQEAFKDWVGDREHGHVICLFGCDHWFDVCISIVQRVGFEEYIEGWRQHSDGHHCRCIWEDEPPVVMVEADCPICEK